MHFLRWIIVIHYHNASQGFHIDAFRQKRIFFNWIVLEMILVAMLHVHVHLQVRMNNYQNYVIFIFWLFRVNILFLSYGFCIYRFYKYKVLKCFFFLFQSRCDIAHLVEKYMHIYTGNLEQFTELTLTVNTLLHEILRAFFTYLSLLL